MTPSAVSARLPSLSALRAFEAAARLRSFKQAAEELSVTATAISHRIRVLENDLDLRLFVRKTRAVELTPAGQALYQSVHEGFAAISAGVERLRPRARPSVTLSTTPAFAARWLVPRLAAFQAAHPSFDLRVHASDDPVDLQGGGADLAIRYGAGDYPGMRSTLLMRDRYAPVASPALRVARPADLRKHALIHFDWHRRLPVELTWAAWARAARQTRLEVSTGIRYSDESHAIQAAVAGQGVALVSMVLVRDELELGLLEARLEPALEGLAYFVLRPAQSARSRAAEAVEAWLLDAARQAAVPAVSSKAGKGARR
ncbi:LysR substrate-binding domain-containing protein [Bordetella genomosp. 13]|uniref:Transcriptional regulator n=1 Tax=Bordetella genomosp. 13 TaxID=463040 RepID=A0A1W6Z7M3_9BORD|nr:LysR substrate-binding domain-containing protein [Bordetella genomosp. 13]ARP93373.1 transcriptional regulator [Bordetella genomosp. 13]